MMDPDEDPFLREVPPVALGFLAAGMAMLLVLLLSAGLYIRTVYMEKRWMLGMATNSMPEREREKLFALQNVAVSHNMRDFLKGKSLYLKPPKGELISPETSDRKQLRVLYKYENPMYCAMCDRTITRMSNVCEHKAPMVKFLRMRDEPEESQRKMTSLELDAIGGYGTPPSLKMTALPDFSSSWSWSSFSTIEGSFNRNPFYLSYSFSSSSSSETDSYSSEYTDVFI